MRNLIFGISCILLFGSFTSSELLLTEKNAENCGCELTTIIESYLAENNPIIETGFQQKELTESEIKSIAHKLCGNIKVASAGGFEKEKFQNYIFEALNVNLEISDDSKYGIISNFLNKYKQKLVCEKSKDKGGDRNRHLYKVAVLEGVIDFYDEILLDDDFYTINLNAYEIVNGKKETLIDYIDYLISTGLHGKSDLELLRDDIIDLGGKRGMELK